MATAPRSAILIFPGPKTAGDLTAVSINIDAVSDEIGGLAGRGAFGLTGGPLASDGTSAGVLTRNVR